MNEIEFLNIPLIEWIGYFASTIVLVSLSLSSILRLRLVNLFGSVLFSFYGFYIGSLPVGIMNLIIVFFNLYYLQKLSFQKEKFEIIESDVNQEFVQRFLVFYKKDILKYFPEFDSKPDQKQMVLMVMRNMNLAGLFIARENKTALEVELDYVTPEYRDYKNGAFLFNHFKQPKSQPDLLVQSESVSQYLLPGIVIPIINIKNIIIIARIIFKINFIIIIFFDFLYSF